MQPHQQLYIALGIVSFVCAGVASAIGLGMAHIPSALIVPAVAVMILCLGVSAGLAPFARKAFPDVTPPDAATPPPTPPAAK
jgi:hypothetical protein